MEKGGIPTFRASPLEAVDDELQTDAASLASPADSISELISALSAAGAEKVMEPLLSSRLTSVSIDLENNLQLTISSDTSTQYLGIESPDFNVEVTLSSASSALNLVVQTTSGVLQRALSTFPRLRGLPFSVAPAANAISSVVPHMSESGSSPYATNAMTSSVFPHMSGSESNTSRKRQKFTSARKRNPSRKRQKFSNDIASALVRALRAEESAPIIIKAYEKHRDVRDAVNAALASSIVRELRAEESVAILMEAYENHRDVRDAVNAAFYQRRVYVHNIPLTAKPMDLCNFFMPFGETVDARIITSSDAEVGVGYVVFDKPEYAEKAANFGQSNFPGSKIFLGSEIGWHAGAVFCSLCGRFY